MSAFVHSSSLAQLWLNPGLEGAAQTAAILSKQRCDEASEDIVRWPGYRPTPLYALPGLAARLGVGAIGAKFEDDRFGVHSFKALGAAYALSRAIGQRIGLRPHEVISGAARGQASAFTAAAATDGNHGRALAWAGQQSGAKVRIYVPRQISAGRVAAMESFGATIIRVAGSYDDAVHRCRADCLEFGWLEITDTCASLDPREPGLEETLAVMSGYALLVDEILAVADDKPTHLFLQAGVGGFAAAAAARWAQRLGADHGAKIVVVEAERAACLLASAQAGRPIRVEGSLETLMAGLACGEASFPAFEILRAGASAFLAISDSVALETMRLFASPSPPDPAIAVGETGVAGMAGVVAVARDPLARAQLDITPTSRILVVLTEGVTDPELYRGLVG